MTTIAGPSAYHDSYNGWDIMERIRYDFPVTCIGLDEKAESFDAYRGLLERGTIYLNTTRRSPMPGSRSEAMLMGMCVVTLNNHDADKYIQGGVTGFLAEDEKELRELLEYVYANPKVAQGVGIAGAMAAREHFSVERFTRDWLALLDKVTGGEHANK